MKATPYENISFILLGLFIFCTPIYPNIIPVLIILIIISLLINFKNLSVNKKNLPVFYISALFYILHVISYTYSVNKNDSLFDLEVKLSIIIWPIIFLFFKKLDTKKSDLILLIYLSGCFFSTLILLYNGTKCYSEHAWIECFSGSYISPNFHTTYISIYYVFCVNILLYFITNNIPNKLNLNKRIINVAIIFLLFYFLFFIIQLQSKGAFISLLASIGVFIYLILKKSDIKLKIVLLSVIIISITIPFILSSNIRERFINSFKVIDKPINELVNDSNITQDGSAARKIAWYVSINKALENPMGYGNGSVKKILTDEYKSMNWKIGQDMYINSHNQFLQTILSVGIHGLLVLIAILLYLFYYSIKYNNILLLAFLIICIVNFMFESMFELQAGIVYICFFISFLYQRVDIN